MISCPFIRRDKPVPLEPSERFDFSPQPHGQQTSLVQHPDASYDLAHPTSVKSTEGTSPTTQRTVLGRIFILPRSHQPRGNVCPDLRLAGGAGKSMRTATTLRPESAEALRPRSFTPCDRRVAAATLCLDALMSAPWANDKS